MAATRYSETLGAVEHSRWETNHERTDVIKTHREATRAAYTDRAKADEKQTRSKRELRCVDGGHNIRLMALVQDEDRTHEQQWRVILHTKEKK